jgi:hypothetical protein
MSNLKVEVIEATKKRREGVNEITGKPWVIYKQDILVELRYERKRIPIMLEENQQPYPVGHYTLDLTSLVKFGKYAIEIDKYAQVNLAPLSLTHKL